jgi:N-methylhydantoinase B
MDDDGQGQRDIRICASVEVNDGTVHVDFAGTAEQVQGNINCPLAVAAAAVLYVFRCLMPPQTPACAGTFAPVTLSAPVGCLLNARYPAAVAAGTVETSMGAGVDGGGLSGVQTHMTNTLNTPIEVLEARYPVRVWCYGLRAGSGGRGRRVGGDGLVRELEFLAPANVSLLTERRSHAPWGCDGGEFGQPGRNLLNGRELPGKVELNVIAGDILRIETPGGGGWGRADGDKREG